MTGRDLIIYILQNNLEDKQVYENGKLIGFMTVPEAALKFGVGTATVELYFSVGAIPGIKIGETILIPANTNLDTSVLYHLLS